MDDLRRAQKDGTVIGLKAVSGVLPRKEIDEFLLQDPDAFNLFLLALRDLQEESDTNKLMSYFQIAGKFFYQIIYLFAAHVNEFRYPRLTERLLEWH